MRFALSVWLTSVEETSTTEYTFLHVIKCFGTSLDSLECSTFHKAYNKSLKKSPTLPIFDDGKLCFCSLNLFCFT